MSSSEPGNAAPKPFIFPSIVPPEGEGEVRSRAYREGFEQGREEGWRKGEAELQETLRRFQRIIEELEGFRKRVLSEMEEGMLELVMEVSRKVIRRELLSDKEAVLRTLREAASKLTDGDRVKIYLSPDDIEIVREHLAEILSHGLKGVELRADPHISPGGCFIETEFGHIDARVEGQLEAIEEGMRREG